MATDAILALGIATAVYLGLWVLVGRDPRSRGVRARNTPPPGISPAGARFLLRGQYDHRMLAAALVDLAVKGLLQLHQYGDDLAVQRTEGDYPAQTLRDQVAELQHELGDALPLFPDEVAGAAGLFAARPDVRLDVSDREHVRAAVTRLRAGLHAGYFGAYVRDNWGYQLAGQLVSLVLLVTAGWRAGAAGHWGAVALIAVTFAVAQTLAPAGYLAFRPFRWALTSAAAGPVLRGLALAVVLALLTGAGFLGVALFRRVPRELLLLLGGMLAVNYLFQYLLRATTVRGRLALDALAGFRRFLAGEARDVPWPDGLAGPTPALFEQYLPYALALDVAHPWFARCAAVLIRRERSGLAYQPHWFIGDAWQRQGPGAVLLTLDEHLPEAIVLALIAPEPVEEDDRGRYDPFV